MYFCRYGFVMLLAVWCNTSHWTLALTEEEIFQKELDWIKLQHRHFALGFGDSWEKVLNEKDMVGALLDQANHHWKSTSSVHSSSESSDLRSSLTTTTRGSDHSHVSSIIEQQQQPHVPIVSSSLLPAHEAREAQRRDGNAVHGVSATRDTVITPKQLRGSA
jgi:hypothetical protein